MTLIWTVFCFLWDDPLFNPTAETDKEFLVIDPDPETCRLHRELRLEALDTLYAVQTTLRQDRDDWIKRSKIDRQVIKQLLPHVPADVVQRILIDRKVYSMDPDFDWDQALGEKNP